MDKVDRRPILGSFASQATGDKGQRDKHTRHHHTRSPEKKAILTRRGDTFYGDPSVHSSNQDDVERRKYRTLALFCPSLCARCDWSTSLGTVANIVFGAMNHAEPAIAIALETNQTMIVLV